MAWFELLQEIEPFDELPFDPALVEALELRRTSNRLACCGFSLPPSGPMPAMS